MAQYKFDPIPEALDEIRKGKLVIVMDSKDREYEGDFIGSALLAKPETINFMVTHARGAYIAVFMPAGRCDQLDIPAAFPNNTSFNKTKFRVSVDATTNASGSSAFDRAETVNRLGDPKGKASDFVRPGHVIPIEAHPQGITARGGHTEAGVELMRLAGINPAVAADLEILDDDGKMAHEEKLFALAKQYHLKIISIEDLVQYVKAQGRQAGAHASVAS